MPSAILIEPTAISSDTAVTGGNADGDGNSLSAQDLEAAGWQPGGRVTVDGDTFTLPTFGAGQADNVLAANQTITMPAGILVRLSGRPELVATTDQRPQYRLEEF